jgi:hypothetical protein
MYCGKTRPTDRQLQTYIIQGPYKLNLIRYKSKLNTKPQVQCNIIKLKTT